MDNGYAHQVLWRRVEKLKKRKEKLNIKAVIGHGELKADIESLENAINVLMQAKESPNEQSD